MHKRFPCLPQNKRMDFEYHAFHQNIFDTCKASVLFCFAFPFVTVKAIAMHLAWPTFSSRFHATAARRQKLPSGKNTQCFLPFISSFCTQIARYFHILSLGFVSLFKGGMDLKSVEKHCLTSVLIGMEVLRCSRVFFKNSLPFYTLPDFSSPVTFLKRTEVLLPSHDTSEFQFSKQAECISINKKRGNVYSVKSLLFPYCNKCKHLRMKSNPLLLFSLLFFQLQVYLKLL